VPVVGYRCNSFPAFYARDSGLAVPGLESIDELAAVVLTQEAMGWPTGMVVANPPPEALALPIDLLEGWIAQATAEAAAQGIAGKDITPFLLAALAQLSAGRTVTLNEALVLDNARLAARLARALQTG
jgi:pseudouridylate synthase